MAQKNVQPKEMSNRLMAMKFMQRGAASPSSGPSTPAEPPSKKQRMSDGSGVSTPPSASRSDAAAAKEAVAAEERQREEAFDREAADRGESKWYLSFKQPQKPVSASPFRVVSAGYSTLDGSNTKDKDSEDEGESAEPQVGRRSFGKFNKGLEKQQNPNMSSDSDSSESEQEEDEEDDDDDDEDDPTGAKALIAKERKEAGDKARAERKARKKAEKAESQKMADERRKKQVKLNGLTSISGAGGGSPGNKNITCHNCNKKGHIQRECPEAGQRGSRRR
ncbi:hypothetical protein KC332_g12580 [Hortaea werneckii]|uniref:CCHC-type domain-containing protein n=2 Tax=Hortaea werneckii TaxID=91943 RepID=A0A3M7IW60_HORWE|nr:hypothetical protein KC358_g12505 [Hortaea werneckii]OTA37064.1 hypothetical protein BTJ68_03121 [Hortaea werneckii EXF-2000]KAI6811661.1 hypothetical protein KC350_g12131 [Hortaea werneckii]KAI6912584.1 hypothetical protein KC348_g12653 [Hortaea werneckii]KAI6927168.1 hypothetical protein KC341_g12304 [Hortaea werneckii]